jgi:hypothetical protein
LRPQDVVLALVLHGKSEWTYQSVADELGLSVSEVHAAVRRLDGASLYDARGRRARTANLHEFLAHGVRYVFPVSLGPVARGMATGFSAPALAGELASGGEGPLSMWVWPTAEGRDQGMSVTPLHRSAVRASAGDPRLHEVLALVDAIRLGRARERSLATRLLARHLDVRP